MLDFYSYAYKIPISIILNQKRFVMMVALIVVLFMFAFGVGSK